MKPSMDTGKGWWGAYEIAVGELCHWCIGPLTVVAERKQNEWHILHWRDSSASLDRLVFGCKDIEQHIVSEDAESNRYAVNATGPSLTLLPALADRAVISKPESPYYVLASETVRVYVRTPVWVRVDATKRKQRLLELPVSRMSDTWFGPNQREGEMCYATRTACRTSLEDFTHWPHGVFTPVFLKNKTDKALTVERIHIPATNLSLHQNENGELWTQPVTLELGKSAGTVELHIGKKLPEEAGRTRLLSSPRNSEHKSRLTRSLAALVGSWE